MYLFDVTQPEKGWIETTPRLGSCIPFLNFFHPLFVEHEHDGNNNFVMFTFDPVARDTVKASLSHKWHTLHALNQPLVFPELPSNVWDMRRSSQLEYHFVHLGGQKVCLVLHKFLYPRTDVKTCDHMSMAQVAKLVFRGRNKGNVRSSHNI